MPPKKTQSDSSATLLDNELVLDAYKRIRKHLLPTPVLCSIYYSELLDARVYLKLESFQPTHSFKVRGALNAILSLPEEKRRKGVVTASGGNHGLGVAFASRLCGTEATIFLPEKTPEIKVKAIKHLGVEVVMHGEAWDEANAHAMQIAAEEDKAYIHPFNDPLVMAGQGTIVTELIEQIRQPDLIVASIGGGGLISGIISAAKHQMPGTQVAGVETVGADCMSRSLESGSIVELPAITSIADSLGAKRTETVQFETVKEHASQVVRVDDSSTVQSCLELLREEKVLAEPAAACCLAALSQKLISYPPGAAIVVVVCGANVGLEKLHYWAQEFSVAGER
jgi:threonine dehydratase